MSSKFSLKSERIRAGFSSNTKLAEEVLTRWVKLDPKAEPPELRSLAAKLSELETNPVWWRNHRKASEALAGALGLRVEDLPLSAAPAIPRRHDFRDFRDLPSLDLARDEPCRLVDVPWWSPELLTRRTWINAPRGAGKTLTASMLRARGEQVIEVPRLADSLQQLPAANAVVIRVEGPDPQTDGTATDALVHDDRRVLVLANFAVPVGPQRIAHAMEVLKKNPREHMSSEQIRDLVSEFDWQRLAWTPILGWRDRFLRWIFDRLGDHHSAVVRKWLEEHDPDCRLFSTPGDVLAVVGRAWESSLARLGPDGLIKWWVERKLKATPSDGGARTSWLAVHGERALHALADAAFEAPNIEYPVRADPTWWSERVPHAVAPASPVAALDKRVQEIAREPRRQQRDALARAWGRDAARVSAVEAIAHLRAAGGLEPSGASSVELAPAWVVEWWAEARLKTLLREEPQAWGRLAAEPSRRRIVEKVLDALAHRPFLELVERVLRECSETAPSLGLVAAVEALFGAVGRRLLKPTGKAAEWPPSIMHALFARQRTWLMPRYANHIPQPLTRASGERSGDAPWIAECWAWSTGIKKPRGGVETTLAWLFPGWSHVSLATIPQWLGSVHVASSPSFEPASILAGQVLQRVGDTALPDRIPDTLVVEAMVMACSRGWLLNQNHVESVLGHERLASLFEARLRAISKEDRSRLLVAFWRALASTPHWSVPRLRQERSTLLDLMVEGLDPREIETSAEGGAIPFWSLRDRALWPVTWWNTAARVLIPKFQHELHGLHDVHLDADATEVVEMLADIGKRDARWMETLWRVAPDRAHARALSAYPDESGSRSWFFAAPPAARLSLCSVIERDPSVAPSWVGRWLVQTLSEAGPEAERVFAILAAQTRGARSSTRDTMA